MEIGAQLKRIREELVAVLIQVSNSQGVSSPVTKMADRATNSVDSLRSQLDSVLCASLPLSDESWRGVYYGATKST